MDQPDARTRKILADILGLVLEDQDGPSQTALAALRRRARQDGVSGGALKELFGRLTGAADAADPAIGGPDPQDALEEAKLRAATLNSTLQQTRARLEEVLRHQQESHQRARLRIRLLAACSALLGLALLGTGGTLLARLLAPVPAPARLAELPAPAPQKPTMQLPPAPKPAPAAPRSAQAGPARPTGFIEASAHESMDNAARQAMAEHLRRCWVPREPRGVPPDTKVHLHVMTDPSGTVNVVQVADADFLRLADPTYRLFVSRAQQSLLDPECSTLPLPASMIGRAQALDLWFTP
jgi:hypothetical protein